MSKDDYGGYRRRQQEDLDAVFGEHDDIDVPVPPPGAARAAKLRAQRVRILALRANSRKEPAMAKMKVGTCKGCGATGVTLTKAGICRGPHKQRGAQALPLTVDLVAPAPQTAPLAPSLAAKPSKLADILEAQFVERARRQGHIDRGISMTIDPLDPPLVVFSARVPLAETEIVNALVAVGRSILLSERP